ncbi:hypothetical protein [Spiroplasma diminutum]|uniref:Transmembrane protein n=1 Tax=Spiroplasma diminutum CUAS-1 TaxID=1276221 RepID=S5MJU6_9MOLU|nr:hypothetical protein [Spiroplasma diminutum]AGR42225.1 hypothetical protein SDIMI_v3c05210 [Spiroplasma diminutum CUAS-1]
MNFLNIWTSSVISGYLFMLLTTAVLIYFFVIYKKRLKKMQIIWSKEHYFNSKLDKIFSLYFYLLIIPYILIMTVFFIFNLIVQNIVYTGFIFTLFYLIYAIQILIYILLLNNKQKSIIAFCYEEQLILFNEIIVLKNIDDVKHNLKRTVIYITFKDEKDLEDIIKIPYHWELFDYFKQLNLKISN